MVVEWKYGGGLFLEFLPLADCMLCEGVGHTYCTCGRGGVDLISGCVPISNAK